MKFRMVDKITGYEPGRSIRGIKTVSFEEYELKTAFSSRPALPECLVMESLVQLGNWLIMLTSGYTKTGLLAGAGEIRFVRLPGPGESLRLDVRILGFRKNMVRYEGQVLIGAETVACGKACLAKLVDLAAYSDPEDLKVLFSEIYSPAGTP